MPMQPVQPSNRTLATVAVLDLAASTGHTIRQFAFNVGTQFGPCRQWTGPRAIGSWTSKHVGSSTMDVQASLLSHWSDAKHSKHGYGVGRFVKLPLRRRLRLRLRVIGIVLGLGKVVGAFGRALGALAALSVNASGKRMLHVSKI